MPTYEYACKHCGQQFEVVQAFSDPALVTCAACGGELRKVFGAVGIVFKGSGFYKTDSRAGSSGNGKHGAATPERAASSADSKPTEPAAAAGGADKPAAQPSGDSAGGSSGKAPASASTSGGA